MISIDVDALAEKIAERIKSEIQPETQRWMSTAEAAEYMRLSTTTLKRMLHEIPHRKVGGKLLFDRTEIDEFITNHPRR